MASSRGRERLKERQTNAKYFVFGSSTPRDLSYMNKIPPKFRSYDAKVRAHREGPGLKEYMEKARSLTRDSSSESRNWAFGSSTPRDLAHMTAISSAQRVYDAKSPKKSVTSPEFVATPVHKRSTTAPQPIQRPTAPTPPKRVDDDAASEPDFVQDRVEFIADLRKKKQAVKNQQQNQSHKASPVKSPQKEIKEEKKMNGKVVSNEESPKNAVPSKTKTEQPPKFSHASELASEVHSTERVPQNLHEEESATAREHTVRGLKDQIVVSELTEAVPAKEIVIDKDGAEDIGKLVEQKSNEILKKVENVSAEVAKDLKDFAKDTKASAEASIMPKVETISAKVTEGLEKAFDSVDEVLKKTDEATTEAAELASRLGSAITGAIAETTATTPSPTKESATQSPAVGSPIEPPHQQIIVGETTATKT
ncbi:hypothetical protein V3C99_000535 [Haemonchus contortus]